MKESIYEVKSIIEELYNEFLNEEVRLNDICDSNSVRIDEIEHKILTLHKNEDVDFRVFSPRNVSPANSEKILELEKEKENLEREAKDSSKQQKYFSERTHKLETALSLLSQLVVDRAANDVPEPFEGVSEVENDPFDELFPAHKTLSKMAKVLDKEDVVDDITVEEKVVVESDIAKEQSFGDEVSMISGSLSRIVHKAEFVERILSNDTIRARLELKEVIKQLRELIK